MKQYYSHGKLLLTGEYLVLDGAMALAVPTKKGQYLTVEPIEEPKILWQSLNPEKKPWFNAEFAIDANRRISLLTEHDAISNQLLHLFNKAQVLNPTFLSSGMGYNITTLLEFPKDWGLGSSSTLINNFASWAEVDAYALLEDTFGGSGYDIACAQEHSPITFRIGPEGTPHIKKVPFDPVFKDNLYFVHLNRKQNSREGIRQYQLRKQHKENSIHRIDDISKSILTCDSLVEFIKLIEAHEEIISNIIGSKTIKSELFQDFHGGIKSLGAWGGDFILVASSMDPTDYFSRKEYHTIVRYEDMVLDQI